MPDGFGTYPDMNCLEYLDFFARAYGLVGRDRVKALRHTLAYTGLDKIAEKSIRGLSKGMRQRLCLGRAMIHDPAVLILDEPANGLDPRARIELRHMIRGLAAEGKALLVSSHILTELGEMCDSIGIIERGELIVSGTVEDIKERLQNVSQAAATLTHDAEKLAAWLEQRDGISKVIVEDQMVNFHYSFDTPADQVNLLRAIVDAEFPILEFSTATRSLEDVFLEITTGAVQ